MFVCENACLEPIYIVQDKLVNVLLSCIGPPLLFASVHFHSMRRLHLLENWSYIIRIFLVSYISASFCSFTQATESGLCYSYSSRFLFYGLNNKLKYVSCKNLERIYFVCLFTFIILKVKFKTSYQRNTRNVSVYIQLPIFG